MAPSLALIIIFGLGTDYLFRRMKLPGLVGMLIAGVLVGPHLLNLMSPEMMTVSGDFRKIALVVILLRAGFELRRETLNRVGRAALIMSSVPAVFEILGVLLVAPRLLHISHVEALVLGSILAAVSPAVVVPLMIDFMDRGRGTKKGIPTLILGASSVDDVFVIVLFTVFLGMYGGTDANLFAKLAEIPVSLLLGIVVGIIPGYLLYRFKDLRGKLGLPHVGERVRNKRFGTRWKVIEEKEMWLGQPDPSNPGQEETRFVPAIHLRFWKEEDNSGTGTGKTVSYLYCPRDPSFQDHWEILYDW